MNIPSYSHVFSVLGRYGPVILFFISLVVLSGKKMTREIYIAGFVVNIFLNSLLKILIKQKRPNNNEGALVAVSAYRRCAQQSCEGPW